ncbi:MAG: hypothetical protein ACLQHA_00205 [Thermoplasmata archaeon]
MGRPGETGFVLPDPMGAATPILPGSSNRAESAITPPALRADRDSQGPSHIAEVGAITFPEPILACEPGARLPTPLTRNCPLAISATRGRGQSDGFEWRVAFGGPDEGEDGEGIAVPTRQFGLLEITSGPLDDSREADERAAERRLRDLRGRVKAARAAISATAGAGEVLRRD